MRLSLAYISYPRISALRIRNSSEAWKHIEPHTRISLPYLVRNAGYEGFDIELCWAALLARRIRTFETSRGLTKRPTLGECGVFDITEVLLIRVGAGL